MQNSSRNKMAKAFITVKEEQRTKVCFIHGMANVHRENNYNFLMLCFSRVPLLCGNRKASNSKFLLCGKLITSGIHKS